MAKDNILVRSMINAFLPKVNSFIESGKLSAVIQEAKRKCADDNCFEGESVEIMISTEIDGEEYINFVTINNELQITKIVMQQKLSEFLSSLIKKL